MASFTPIILSGSTNGLPVKIVATATAGTLIHTAVAGTSDCDYIWLDVENAHTAAVDLTVEWGGVTSPDDLLVKVMSIPIGVGLVPVCARKPLRNTLVVRAFASVANVLRITGRVTRFTA